MRVLATSVVVLAMTVGLQAEDKPAAQPDQTAMEQLMMEMAKVGPHHEKFKEMVGTWNTVSKDFTKGDKPVVSKGVATFELMLGGRYLKQTFKGEYYGMPFEGIGTTGYDNVQQKYVGTWIDNFSTSMMNFTGTVDEATGVQTDMAEMVTPMGKMKMKMVTEPKGDDAMLFTMYMLGPDGGETKHMTIDYTRK